MKKERFLVFALLSVGFVIPLIIDQTADASSTFFYSDKTTYVKGDNILIYGSVGNYDANTPITIQILDNKNNSLLVSNTYPKPDASFIARIPTNNTNWKSGGPYDIKIRYGSVYIGDSMFVFYADQLSPLKQADAGAWFSNITCNSGLVTIMKQEDGTVACVKPTSLQKLISLNWGYDPSEKLTVYGLKNVYKVGQEIDIKFRIHTFGSACSYPQVIVRSSDQKIVWQSSPMIMGCPVGIRDGEYESEGSLGNNTSAPGYPMGLLIINQPGTYSVNISWLDGNVTKEFAIVSQTSENVTMPTSSIPLNTYPQNNTGTISIRNQTFYFTTLNDTLSSYHGVGAIPFTFNDVDFTLFPSVFAAGPPGSCGDTNFGSEVKFTDGTYERLGVYIPGEPCSENYTETVLSNHQNLQAGIQDYHGKIRLLVSVPQKTPNPISNSKITHMELKAYGFVCCGLDGDLLEGNLSSNTDPISDANVTISINGIMMGYAKSYSDGCFQFNQWNGSKLSEQTNEFLANEKNSGVFGPFNLAFSADYAGDDNHYPASANATSSLYLTAIPLPPPQLEATVTPSEVNVTQGSSSNLQISVRPMVEQWNVIQLSLYLEGLPCGVSYHISKATDNYTSSTTHPAVFDISLNTTTYSPEGRYFVHMMQNGTNPLVARDIGAFGLNILKMR